MMQRAEMHSPISILVLRLQKAFASAIRGMIHNPPGAMDEAHNFCFSKSSHRVSLNCACAFAIFQSQIIDSFAQNLWYTYPPWNDIQSSKPCEITEEPREMQCIHQE